MYEGQHSMSKKIAYVIIREDLESPVIQSQVLDVLQKVLEYDRFRIQVVWFYRLDYLFRSKRRLRQIKTSFFERGLQLIAIPFISLRFPVQWFLIVFVLPQWIIGLCWVYLKYRIDVFHCRSYHSAVAACLLKFIVPLKYIFDPRSPMPEEMVAANRWGMNGINYKFWKIIEKWLVLRSNITIATSNAFRSSLIESTKSVETTVIVVPNNYVESLESRTTNMHRHKRDRKSDPITVCYAGSLGHWNKAVNYITFLECIMNDQKVDCRAKFVVPLETVRGLEIALTKSKLNLEKISIVSATYADVVSELAECTVGLQIMTHVDTRLSIKFVEYLAAGLPVIVSENVMGAAEIVREYGVGILLDGSYRNIGDVAKFITNVSLNKAHWNTKCCSIAAALFSTDSVARSIKNAYCGLDRGLAL